MEETEKNHTSELNNSGIKPGLKIDPLKRAEEQSGLLLKVLETSPDSIFATDEEGKIIFVNTAACTTRGYSEEELLQMKMDDLIIPELKTVAASHKSSLCETGHAEYETTHLCKDGSTILLEVRSQAITWDGQSLIVISAHDISKRKDDERELFFRAYLLDSAIDAIIVSDESGDVVYVNEAACKMHGYTKEEMQKMNLADIVSGFSNEVRKHEADSIFNRTGGTVLEAVHIRKNKSTLSVEVHNSHITLNDKKLILSFFRDITERKRAQEEIQQTNEKLTVLINKFETQNHINKVVSELRDLLEVCSNIKETAPIISSAVQKIFPGVPGALLLMSESRSDLESVARWGGFPEDVDENVFSPGDCWGLRRGRVHIVDSADGGPVCAHVKQVPESGYMCLPLIAKGNVTGLLHLRNFNSAATHNKQTISDMTDAAVSLSEQLSLAISNVKLTESLSQQSIVDPLSALYNRRYMEESLIREIARARRKKTQVGIIMADLDHFKKFNDTFGHLAGDSLISQVGRIFKKKFRVSDIPCRYGGEEFVFILGESNPEDTRRRAEELKEDVKKLEVIFQGQLLGSVTISMGVASYPKDGESVDDLLRVADTALYKAKQSGRDKVIVSGD